MYLSKNLRRFLMRSAAVGYISLSLAFSGVFAGAAYAGPADDASVSAPAPGPGQGPGSDTAPEAQTPTGNMNNYYYKTLSDPVVNPVDKYSYEQMEQDINALSARYGNRMTVNVIGQSLDGRNIYDIVIGNPGASKKVLFQGAIHAREYIVVPLMMQQLEYMLAFYDSGTYNDQSVSSILRDISVHFVPMANPDGVAISQFGDGAIRSEELRQGISSCYVMDVGGGRTSLSYDQYLTRWKSNARGVDLNHNFDAGWETLNPDFNHYSFTDFKGYSPLSEPETQALSRLTEQHAFSAVINYHAMGRVLYWSTEGNQKITESYDMAVAASGVTGYQILNSNGVGGFKDWLQRRSNPVAGITIEVGRSACPVAFSEYPAIWEQNREIPILFCKYVATH